MKIKTPLPHLGLLAIFLIGLFINARGQWQFVKGESYNPQLPKYGILNQSHSYNWPGARNGAVTWTYNGCLYLFGGNSSTGYNGSNNFNDIWKHDPATGLWTWIKGPAGPDKPGNAGTQGIESPDCFPAARSYCNYWVVGNYLYIYSGDWWRYNFITNNWTYMGGNMSQNPINNSTGPIVYGQLGVAAASNNPANRSKATCWAEGNYLYLFGGMINSENGNDLWRYDLTTNMWTWIKGSNTFTSFGASYGVEGTIGIEDAMNRPCVRSGAICTKVGNMVYLYGGYTGLVNTASDLWRYNITTNNWTRLSGTFNLSLPVFGSLNTYNANNKPGSLGSSDIWSQNGGIFLFGGGYGDGGPTNNIYNTIWQFDTSLLQWRYINGAGYANPKGRYNYKNVTSSSNQPGARSGSLIWKLDNNLYFTGGGGLTMSGSATLADFWKYNTNTSLWTWVGGSDNCSFTDMSYQQGVANINNRPAAGNYGARWTVNNDVYIFSRTFSASNAAYNTLPSSDQIWKYSNANNDWTLVRPMTADTTITPIYGTLGLADSQNTPGTRAGEAYWVYNNKLYLFGGQSNHYITWTNDYADSLMNDLWEYDLATKKWRWIKGSNICTKNGTYGTVGVAAVANTPGGRMTPQFWQANNKFYLMGGRGKGETGSTIGSLNDLWEYDPVTNNWRWLKGSKVVNQSSTFGTKGVANAANTPGGRVSGICWATSDKLYTFLGRGIEPGNSFATPNRLNELWSYDIATNNWTWLKGSNSPIDYTVEYYVNYGTKGVAGANVRPYVADGGTGSVINGKFYLYGGTTNYAYAGGCNACGGARNDLWEYDPATNYWKWVEGAGASAITASYPDTPVTPVHIWPGVVNNSVGNLSWAYGQRFYIFGGSVYSPNNETWGYNLCSNPASCNNTNPQVGLGVDTTLCSGSSKELNAGNFGSSYLWNTGETTQTIIATQSGSYWVKVTNPANLAASDTINLTFVAPPIVPFGGNQLICAGQTYTLNAQNPGCTYSWSTGASGSTITVDTTGNYSVTITTSGGCAIQAAMTIQQMPLPNVDLGADTGECSTAPGWPQHAIITNYVPNQHYLWSTGDTTDVIFVTQSGSYNVQVTNEYGCMAYDTVFITYDTPIVFSLGSDTAICPNNSLVLDATHTGCTYLWSDNSTDSVLSVNFAGIYSVYLTTRFGCQTFDDINITELPLPQATAIHAQINTDTVLFSVTNAQNTDDYVWFFGDNTTGTGASPTHIYTQSGSYNVILVISNGCGSDTLLKTVMVQLPQPNGIKSIEVSSITVFPNPANTSIYIQSKTEKIKRIVIFNTLGQKMFDSGIINTPNINLNISEFNTGMYQLQTETASGLYTEKLIINR